MRYFIIILILIPILVDGLVLYRRVPKPKLVCHEEYENGSNSTGNMSHDENDDVESGTLVEHVRSKRKSVIQEPSIWLNGSDKSIKDDFSIVSASLSSSEKNELKQKIINMCKSLGL
uniref:Uncharacterized protein n=1 Tax=Rhabditophanes sp. KR3021 TaxID=114890 RepID=A0AC35TYC9_9BILA